MNLKANAVSRFKGWLLNLMSKVHSDDVKTQIIKSHASESLSREARKEYSSKQQ